MDFRLHIISGAVVALWLACGHAHGDEVRIAGRLLVDLDASDFVTGSDHWPQHSEGTGIPGHFIPKGSPTRQTVAGAPAVVFDGDGDSFYGPITTSALHAPGATHTVEVWVYQGNIRDQESLVSWGKRGGPDSSFAGFRYGAHPDFGAVATWASSETGFTSLPPPGKWHHLAYTYDGRRQVVYVDGKPDSDKDVGVLDAHDSLPILLGAELRGDMVLEGKFSHFSGALGKVRIHSKPLGADAVLANYRTESPQFPGLSAHPLVRPPQHRFSCNAVAGPAPDGTAIADSIGGLTAMVRGNDAVFTGSGVRLPGGSSASEAYLDLPNRLVSSQENVTIELWVTQEAKRDWCRIVSIGTNRSGEITGPGGGFDGSETLTLFGNVGAAPVNRFARSEGTLLNGGPDHDPADYPESDLGTEFHQVIVYQKSPREWRWYRNGVLMEVIPDAEGPSTLDDVNVWLGRSEFSADNNFQGVYREIRIYNRALDEGEIYGNFKAGPDKLNLAAPMPALCWTAENAGVHRFSNSGKEGDWGVGGTQPNGIGATATFASALTGDQTLELDVPLTLGTLNLGACNSGGSFILVPRRTGALTLDAGVGGPASLAQLPDSRVGRVEVPITFASDVEIANFSEQPLILGGLLHGRGNMVKTGPGPLVLSGDSPGYQGAVRILTGTLVLGDAGHSGWLPAARFTVTNPGGLVINHRDDFTIAPVVEGTGQFFQQGQGRLTLTGDAVISNTGNMDVLDGAGTLVSEGRIDGPIALRIDGDMILAGQSSTHPRDFLGIGFRNGGHLTIRDSASITLTEGQGAFNVGDAGTGQSVCELESGTVFWRELFIGKYTGTSGILLQSGGDLTKKAGGGDSRVGGAFEGSHDVWGAWRLTGGTFFSDHNLQIGAFGNGLLEIDGGSAAVRGFLGIGRFKDGQGNPSRGLVDVKSGRLATTSSDHLLLVGEEGIGVLNIRGSGEVVCSNDLIIGAGTLAKPGTGTVNLLQGGTLTAATIGQYNQSKANGSLNFDGGVLKAGASGTSFIEGLDSAYVRPGGMVLNTNGFDVTIGQVLLAPDGDGVRAIPVTQGGSGYLAAPLLEITGGGGSGATAVANLANGAITGITITNPGCGYTSAPSVTVFGGGNGTGLATGTLELGPNKSGGLTKTGVGTLTLRGDCTYTGVTTVERGGLLVESDLSAANGGVIVAKGATLGGSGTLGGSVRAEAGSLLAPGSPVGILTARGDVLLQGSLAISINATHASQLEVGGLLDLAHASLVANATGDGAARIVHVIARYGSLRGRFDEASLPPGFKLDYQHGGVHQIALVPTADANGE